MSDLITAIQKAIADICAARLCEVNSMSSRQEMLRLMIQATDTLRAALEQQEQEPVAKYSDIVSDGGMDPRNKFDHPPRREWQGLTDTEIGMEYVKWDATPGASMADFARAIEAALKEKNQ
jgi:hypothetical protein